MTTYRCHAYPIVLGTDANAAAGEPLAMKAKAFSMPGVTVDGVDPEAVYAAVGEAVDRARSGAGPTLVETKVYRLSAHGNIIVPPGIPLHFPEHEATEVFGDAEEYEAANRGDPEPRCRAKLVPDGALGWRASGRWWCCIWPSSCSWPWTRW